MSKARILILALATGLVLVAISTGGAGGASVACQSGNYKGNTAGGHKLSFKVDCASKTITDLNVTFNVKCLSDNHRESGTAGYSGKIKIKFKSYPDPDRPGKREKVYYLGYNPKASELVANGTDQTATATMFLRGTAPPNGTTKGTVNVSYRYGEDPNDESGYLYYCGGIDGNGPAKFTAKRS